MKDACIRLAAGLVMSWGLIASASADEAVLRVIDVKAPIQPATLEHRLGSDASWFQAFVGTTGAIHDRFRTSPNTVAALEFFIGGRVGLSKDTEIEVITDRSVHDMGSVRRIILHNGALWAKSGRLRQPLEIQTNGGILGIKGTEFVLESSNGNTELAVLEGAVDVSDTNAQPVGTAGPGDSFSLRSEEPQWQKRHRDPEELRRELEESPVGQAIAIIQEEIQLVRRDLSSAGERLQHLQDMLNKGGPAYELAAPYGKALHSGLADPPLASMEPNENAPANPVFRWGALPGADGYVLFLAADPKYSSLLYSVRTRDNVAVYPTTARPLAPGSYHWRVIPVDAQDQPLQGASEGHFQVAVPR